MAWYQLVVGGCERDGYVARIYAENNEHIWSAERMPTPRDAVRAATGDGFMERVFADLGAEAALRVRMGTDAVASAEERSTRVQTKVPIGVDAETVAKIAEPGDLWVRSNDLVWDHMQNADGRGSWPAQPTDRPCSWSRRLVGPWRKMEATRSGQIQEAPDA